MLKFIFLGYLSILFFQSCSSSKKNNLSQTCLIQELPYEALDRKKMDTTFDYELFKKRIILSLPDSIFGKNTKGAIGFYSMINSAKQVVDINFSSASFFRKKEMVYSYDKKNVSKFDERLKSYLLQIIKSIPFKQNSNVTLESHATFCFIEFYK